MGINCVHCWHGDYMHHNHSTQSGDPFVDPDFRPDNSALYMRGGATVGRGWMVKDWRRPPTIRVPEQNDAPWTVFRTPRPSDISQGALGNCWYIHTCVHMYRIARKFHNCIKKTEDFVVKIFCYFVKNMPCTFWRENL